MDIEIFDCLRCSFHLVKSCFFTINIFENGLFDDFSLDYLSWLWSFLRRILPWRLSKSRGERFTQNLWRPHVGILLSVCYSRLKALQYCMVLDEITRWSFSAGEQSFICICFFRNRQVEGFKGLVVELLFLLLRFFVLFQNIQILIHELSGTGWVANGKIWEASLGFQSLTGITNTYLLQMLIKLRLFWPWSRSLGFWLNFWLIDFRFLLFSEYGHEIIAHWRFRVLFHLLIEIYLFYRTRIVCVEQSALLNRQSEIGKLLAIKGQFITTWGLSLSVLA